MWLRRVSYFNPRPPCGGRLRNIYRIIYKHIFQSTPPVWGATQTIYNAIVSLPGFQSTPPVWGATSSIDIFLLSRLLFQSTPPVWGATPSLTHNKTPKWNFNPRPPCGGRPQDAPDENPPYTVFQSTPPVWGATNGCSWPAGHRTNFNPRPPCGGRRQKQLKIQAVLVKNRQFLQISSSNSYPILKNKVASLQIILQNLVRDLGDFLRAYVSHLKHQYIFWVVGCLYSKMLDLVFIAVSQVIKTKTVLFRVHDLTQLCL